MDMITGYALFVTHIHKLFRLFENKCLRFVEMDVRIQACAALCQFLGIGHPSRLTAVYNTNVPLANYLNQPGQVIV